jgi:hypothetical protein
MDLVIHTFGYIDAMFYTLNAIAMLTKGAFGHILMTSIAMITIFYYALRISYAGHEGKKYIVKVIGMLIVIMTLLEIKTEMLIFDHVSKKKEKVDNIPLAFALPVGFLETFGDLLTAGFEQAFVSVDNANYHDYGMLFGARLVQEARNWRIRSPEFLENMNNFIDRCVIVDAMIGHYYTHEDLLTTNDIWGLVSKNAGTLRQVSMRIGKEKELMSCKKAAFDVIAPNFKLEIEGLEKKYAKTDIGEAGNSNFVQRSFFRNTSNLQKNIQLAFASQLSLNSSAEELVRQQMMVNAMSDMSGDSNYGYARANMTQESNWLIAGNLANTVLPILMTVFKCLVYSSFIFLIPIMIMSGGWSKYLGWITLSASFQLWGPLNAVLNMFADLYSSNHLSGIADNIVSFSAMSSVGNYTDKIVAVASGLQISIPFLAFSIMQGGVSGFIHLAGNITGASSSAASAAANEVATGNKSFDNYSVGNRQLYNQSGFKTDWNQSYASGASTYQHLDGTLEKVTGSGNTLLQSGVGITASAGETSFRFESNRQGQITEGIQTSEGMHEQTGRSFSNAKHNTFSRASDYVSHLAQRQHSGETFNYESMGEQGKALQQAVNHTIQMHDKQGYQWNQAGRMALEGSMSYKTPILVSAVTGADASANINGSVSATNSSEQSVDKTNGVSRDNNTSESYNSVVKAASNSSWARENNIDNSYSDSVRSSYEEQQRLEQQLSVTQQRVNDWHTAQSIYSSHRQPLLLLRCSLR